MTAGEGAPAREKKRVRDRARNEALPDSVVLRALIRGTTLARSNIPPDLITLKREHILNRRVLRQLNAANRLVAANSAAIEVAEKPPAA